MARPTAKRRNAHSKPETPGARMATDGAAKSDSNRAWPGDYPAAGLAEYCNKLVQNGYVKPDDLQRVLSAPNAQCAAMMSGRALSETETQQLLLPPLGQLPPDETRKPSGLCGRAGVEFGWAAGGCAHPNTDLPP